MQSDETIYRQHDRRKEINRSHDDPSKLRVKVSLLFYFALSFSLSAFNSLLPENKY